VADKGFAFQHEGDALSGLEDRIQKAVALVGSLRQEIERLNNEVAVLRDERTTVRNRIEKLLGHIDQLSL
jgi:uncharacterized coiled-coil DUF342 family protein